MSRFKELRKKALTGLIAGFERADEIGGEIRDFIQDQVLVDERYVALRRRVAAMQGKTYVSRAEQEAEQDRAARAAAAAAPPPAASVPVAEARLGNPELPAQIYGTEADPWTGRAITLLESLKVDYDFVDMDDADNEHFRSKLVAETTQNNVPYIFVRGQFIGGFNALSELQRAGTLEYLLMSPEERENANPALKNTTVTPRPNSDEITPGESG